MTHRLGEPLARGSRSVVHRWGPDAVAKVPLPSLPEGWIRFEAAYASAVHAAGAPVPAVLGVESVDGLDVVVYERVDGPSMWDSVCEQPERAAEYGTALGNLHLTLLELTGPLTVPSQHSRLACKIRDAARLVDVSLLETLRVLQDLPSGARLCHGDLHPKNVIMSTRGPIVVDWFDVSRGNPHADIARTSLLLQASAPIPTSHATAKSPSTSTGHLPGASAAVVDAMLDAYRGVVDERWAVDPDTDAAWHAVAAAARIAEGVDPRPLIGVIHRYRTGAGGRAGAAVAAG